jgi:hypothetical protein
MKSGAVNGSVFQSRQKAKNKPLQQLRAVISPKAPLSNVGLVLSPAPHTWSINGPGVLVLVGLMMLAG